MRTKPDGWERVTLGEVAELTPNSFVDGPFGSDLKTTDYAATGVRLIQLQNIGEGFWVDDNKKFIPPRKFQALSRHAAYPGDIAIAKMADPVARACLIPPIADQFVVVADCIKLAPDKARHDPRYLVYAINYRDIRQQAEQKSTGTTRQRINLSVLKTLRLLAPPLPEQRRIADILDTVDAAIQQTEALIAKLKLMKAGLLHDLLTRGLDEQGNLRDPIGRPEQFKDSPLGRIPRGWEIKTLSQVAETYAGGTPSRSVAGMFGGQIPWVKSAELNQVEIAETEESLSQMGYQSSSVKWVPENTPLIAMYGATAGVVSWLKICAVTNQAVLAVPPRTERTDARWLYWVLSFNSWKLVASVQGSGQPNLSKSLIDALRIAQPVRLEEQRAIATILDAHDARLRAEEAYCDKLKQMKKGLMRDLLTGRVRVQAEEEAL